MKVTFVTVCEYPLCDAGAKRFVNLSYAFRSLGFDCFFVGRGYTPRNQVFSDSFGQYVSVRRIPKRNLFSRFVNLPFREADVVNYALKKCGDSSVFVASQYFGSRLMRKMQKFCAKKHITLIYAPMEFFSPTEFPLHGCFSLPFWRLKHFYASFTPSMGKVISISSYLDSLFQKKGVASVRVPFVYSNTLIPDAASRDFNDHQDLEKLVLMYAGSPFRKDCLLNMIRGLENVDHSRIVFHVFGAAQDWLKKNHLSEKEIQSIHEFCVFHGKVGSDVVVSFYHQADFTVLLRRAGDTYAKAGFPTKVTESLAYGVPVISNLTSDLGMYLTDGYNSIISQSEKMEDFALAINRALKFKRAQLAQMRINARRSAEANLESQNFVETLQRLLADGEC
jgi:glycosyltransferase involved in cell wall biosynthesis